MSERWTFYHKGREIDTTSPPSTQPLPQKWRSDCRAQHAQLMHMFCKPWLHSSVPISKSFGIRMSDMYQYEDCETCMQCPMQPSTFNAMHYKLTQ
jgi:hypothetical protein